MNRKTIPLIAAVTFAAAPLAKGQAYIGSVLYPLTTPSGFVSIGLGDPESGAVSANQAIGFGYLNNPTESNDYHYHALLWTTAGPVDLNPTNLSGMAYSQANGANGTQQVGEGWGHNVNPFENGHALLWTGTAASVPRQPVTDL
ncbi:MAG: hypothetical protein ABSD28_07405 [Tepidisphaeraceae bacterium]|jgi:hypothetical protein